jgi:hypothetical protein
MAGGCGASPDTHVDGADTVPVASATQPSGPSALAATACAEGALRTCKVQLPGQGSVHQCFVGKQLCTSGAWTDCQDLTALVGLRVENFAASCPPTHIPRWTSLDYVVDAPTDPSGSTAATIKVAGHPEIVLLDTQSGSGGVHGRGGAGSRDLASVLGSLLNASAIALDVTTSTTPDGDMASTAAVLLKYDCVAPASP